jgi:hypothetical protein
MDRVDLGQPDVNAAVGISVGGVRLKARFDVRYALLTIAQNSPPVEWPLKLGQF